MLKENEKKCYWCNKAMSNEDLVYYDKYFGGSNYCSKQCMLESFFEDLSGGYEVALAGKEVEKVYEVELFHSPKIDKTIFRLFEYCTSSNTYKLIHGDYLSYHKDNTISTFFYCWAEDYKDVIDGKEQGYSFLSWLLELNPNLINLVNTKEKEFKNALISFQEEFKGSN